MICPNCNSEPMSFGKFLFQINPLKIQCQSCGTMLKSLEDWKFVGKWFWKYAMWPGLILLVLAPIFFGIFAVYILICSIFLAKIFWKKEYVMYNY